MVVGGEDVKEEGKGITQTKRIIKCPHYKVNLLDYCGGGRGEVVCGGGPKHKRSVESSRADRTPEGCESGQF